MEALALRERLANAADAYLEVDPALTVRDTPEVDGLLGAAAAELLACAGYMHLAEDHPMLPKAMTSECDLLLFHLASESLADSTMMP